MIICEIILHLLVIVQNNLTNSYGTYKIYIYYLKYNFGVKVHMEVFVWRCVRHYTLIGGHQRLGGTSCRRLHVRSKEGRKMALNVKWTFIVGQYLLTPWNRVLLEQPTSFQLVKKFSSFYGTRRFITAFTSARHLSLS